MLYWIAGLAFGLFFGFIAGCVQQDRKWKAYRKSVIGIIKQKDNTINMWCKRINKKKEAVEQGKHELKKQINDVIVKTNECYRSIDKVFKEQS